MAFGLPDEDPTDVGPEPSLPPDVVPPSAARVTWPPHATSDIAPTAKRMVLSIRAKLRPPRWSCKLPAVDASS